MAPHYRPAKTVWDWLGLLIIPALLAGGGYWFTHRREELTRELEIDRLREEALQGYLDRMTELMLDKSLIRSEKDDPVRDVARSQTLLALRRLDGERKGLLLRFLSESKLIVRGSKDKAEVIIGLGNADLIGAELRGAWLTGVDLGFATLTRAVLDGAILAHAYLAQTDLRGADLRGADLTDVHLTGADLREASLAMAYFTGADLIHADLRGADLRGAEHLTQDQLNLARGDATTKLPDGLARPASWGSAAT